MSYLLLLIGILLILLFIGVPIAISLGLATAFIAIIASTSPLEIIPQQMFNSINSFPLMAIPFFVLAGALMQHGGISNRLVAFAQTIVGHLTGGLAMVAVLTSMFFAAISGSGAATTAAIGAIMIPAMIANGYRKDFATANQAVSGALGVIIPPSIPLILYAISAKQSAGDMFTAGILPGLFITATLLITAYIYSKKKKLKGIEKSSLKEVFKSFYRSILSILMPVIVLGGIYGGIFTPTEAAVIAVVYSLIIGLFIYRELDFKKLPSIFMESAMTTGIILIIISTAGILSFTLNRLGIPDMIKDSFLEFTTSVVVFIILVNLLLLVVGMFMEAAAAILIFVPILLPIALSLGIDPVHFGIIVVVNLAIGLVTPPVGLNLFVAMKISRVSLPALTKAVIPFVIILFVDVLIISFIPSLSTFLVNLM